MPRSVSQPRPRRRLQLAEELEAEAGGRVGAGAEGLAGVDDDVDRALARRLPGGAQPEPAGDQQRLVEVPPAVGPVVGDLGRADLDPPSADRRVERRRAPAAPPRRRRSRTRRSRARAPPRPRSAPAPSARRGRARPARARQRTASRINRRPGARGRRGPRRAAARGSPPRASRRGARRSPAAPR